MQAIVKILLSGIVVWTLVFLYWRNQDLQHTSKHYLRYWDHPGASLANANFTAYTDPTRRINSVVPTQSTSATVSPQTLTSLTNTPSPDHPHSSHTDTRGRDLPLVTICTLSKSQTTWKGLADSDPAKIMMPSIHRTVQSDRAKFRINVLIGVDDDDDFWAAHSAELQSGTGTTYNVSLSFRVYTKSKFLPFNSLMRDALDGGADYLVRVNDDTEFKTGGWVSLAVELLATYDPPNVGVVGPLCRQGNTNILTHDMVHRTHLEIFPTYYPSVFHNWYVDDWITLVYGPKRTTKMLNWEVFHHAELGTRYEPVTKDGAMLNSELALGGVKIRSFIQARKDAQARSHLYAESHNHSHVSVLSYSLYGENARYIQGAIENAKLHRTIYPGWLMTVYHDSSVPAHVLSILKSHRVHLQDMSRSKMNKMSWRFTATNLHGIDRFCSRDIDSRLSLREKHAVDAWIESGRDFHVMRDHPSHSAYSMSGGMWCASATSFAFITDNIPHISTSEAYLSDMDWLNKYIWSKACKNVLQHDSFSCDQFGGGHPFPSMRVGWEHVGSVYIDGEMRKGDVDILRSTKQPPRCTAETKNDERIH